MFIIIDMNVTNTWILWQCTDQMLYTCTFSTLHGCFIFIIGGDENSSSRSSWQHVKRIRHSCMWYVVYVFKLSRGAQQRHGDAVHLPSKYRVNDRFKVVVLPSPFDFESEVLKENGGPIRTNLLFLELFMRTIIIKRTKQKQTNKQKTSTHQQDHWVFSPLFTVSCCTWSWIKEAWTKWHGRIENWQIWYDVAQTVFLAQFFTFSTTSKSYYFCTLRPDRGITIQAEFTRNVFLNYICNICVTVDIV